jgi:hypothetical protein
VEAWSTSPRRNIGFTGGDKDPVENRVPST